MLNNKMIMGIVGTTLVVGAGIGTAIMKGVFGKKETKKEVLNFPVMETENEVVEE